ncbi:MAG TPA: SRPBCC domain-containing protein [Streptosporangiaceae bacterium]|nr:SRPBCC domain-containing protein [Streptosporangiaceae bacterium]
MHDQEVIYQLNMSRIFGMPPRAVYRAFVQPRLLAVWFPRSGWSMPPEQAEIDPRPGGKLRYVLVSTHEPVGHRVRSAEFSAAQEDTLLAWTWEPSSRGRAGGAGPAHTVEVEFIPEPHRTTRLELREEPFSEAAEIDARECWNCAFGRLDRALADVTVGS